MPDPAGTPLLLAILSILGTWALLTVLIVALFMILKPLQSIRHNLERIALGVRAIEHQVEPLGAHVDAAGPNVVAGTEALERLGEQLRRAEAGVKAAAPAFRAR